ncbi:796_t:CDS:1, partial [Funneliformis geosporum]
ETVYIDEVQGSDETGTGTRDAPYKTAVHSLQTKGDSIKILVQKTSEEGYKDISGAALKKAKKRVDDLAKKAKKEEEKRKAEVEKAKLQKEEEERKLEEAKSIVLEQDSTLPQAIKVK